MTCYHILYPNPLTRKMASPRAFLFFFSSRRRHTRFSRDWSSDVCSSRSLLDRILWQWKHGKRSEPPPPGPNAAGVDELGWRRHGISDAEALRETIKTLGLDRDAVRERYAESG